MEDTLGAHHSDLFEEHTQVLILVLMEDTLGANSKSNSVNDVKS
mgnify:CR=1 FL=1